MFIDLFNDVQARIVSICRAFSASPEADANALQGTKASKSCFVKSLIQDGLKYDLNVKESAWLAGSLL